jgi:hypothetical protein
MDWKPHGYRVGAHFLEVDDVPASGADLDKFMADARKQIEPWLSAVFQSEHLNVLLGSGFAAAVANAAGGTATNMAAVAFGSKFDAAIDKHAKDAARTMGRGSANIEDQLRSALALYDGLNVTDLAEAAALRDKMDAQLSKFLLSLLNTERQIANASTPEKQATAYSLLQSFLLSCASRAASRERLHIFTTNYDRLIEHGCDLAGLRIIDRFVGALTPLFRSTRVEIDVHYNPPGIRGEPRFMEGVVRLTKLHGSLDWQYDKTVRAIRKLGIPFGAPETHTDIPKKPIETVMIYPNPAKDVETTAYPYAELFRDMAAAVCRPNAVVVTYGYGFGDDHVNRILLDMLTIPSTHIVIIAYHIDERIKAFCARVRDAQVTLLLGPHFAALDNLTEQYFPKPALDYITGRLSELLRHRPIAATGAPPATA